MLKNQKGSTGTAELIIMVILLMTLTFGGVDYWVTFNQYQQAEHLKNQYLDTARLHGCLEDGKMIELQESMEKLGFDITEISVVDAKDEATEYSSENRAVRKLSDSIDNIPELKLMIEGNFARENFWIANTLGNKEGNESEKTPIRLQGTTYTEYVAKD